MVVRIAFFVSLVFEQNNGELKKKKNNEYFLLKNNPELQGHFSVIFF